MKTSHLFTSEQKTTSPRTMATGTHLRGTHRRKARDNARHRGVTIPSRDEESVIYLGSRSRADAAGCRPALPEHGHEHAHAPCNRRLDDSPLYLYVRVERKCTVSPFWSCSGIVSVDGYLHLVFRSVDLWILDCDDVLMLPICKICLIVFLHGGYVPEITG